MDTCLKECDTIHPDLELTVLDSTEAEAAENAEDEVKELHNSLKEIVHDQDVQPKLQCIMMDPSFSMVTVQGEESSIVWETPAAEVSGRSECSTPWILEAGITPEGYSVEGSGLSGHITIEMDEGKIRRGKGTSSGIKASERSGRDTSKTARVPSEAERPAMVEVSVPNIVQENTSDITVDSNEVKEQQLFSIVSEGYEILNIVVPSKLLTVDEEESNQMNDNLFYLEDSPMIKLKEIPEEPDPIRSSFEMNILHEAQLLKDEQCSKQDEVPQLHSQPLKPDPSRFSQSLNGRPTKTDGTLGADYFEKFTLMDEYSPVDYLSDTEDQVSSKRSQGKETIQTQKNVLDVPIGPEGQDNLASITDVEIPSEHIDEIFYGCSYNDEDENVAREELDEEEVEQPKLAFKASGSALFDSEEPTLSPIFLSPGPPKIIDPILLEEPPAMSFLYSDLYADAVGSRKTEDDAIEEVESIASSPLSFEGWLSDIEDVNGYLEKFILIDETPVLERDNGLRVQSQNPLEFLSALTPVQEEVEEKVTKADNDKLCELISVLQGKSENTEEFASALDLAYHSVEEYCKRNAQSLEKLNGEVAKKVKHLYEEMSQCMGENKRFKLELIRCRIGTIKKSMESAREALEMTLRMMEESTSKDIKRSQGAALQDDHTKISKGVSVPQRPVVQAQEASSATCFSITVCWKVSEGDIISCFHVYRKAESQGGTIPKVEFATMLFGLFGFLSHGPVSGYIQSDKQFYTIPIQTATPEEHKVMAEESSCILGDLAPDSSYEVWVMAENEAGCSAPSEKMTFRTAPSAPVINTKKCSVLWDSATIRWSCAHPAVVETYTLEYCRQCTSEGEGLRSIAGIKGCEQNVSLHPNETYLFYVKAVNFAGASEQSEGALISTRGTKFYLLKDTAHSALEVSEDCNVVHYPRQTFSRRFTLNTPKCPAVWGEILPPSGHYYWETEVGTCEAYRIGVAYQSASRDVPVGEDGKSWCFHCASVPASVQYELLHNKVQTSICVEAVPARIGTLLDYKRGRLSFFNAHTGQLLGSLQHVFTEACRPTLGLERPGALTLQAAVELPEFAREA